MCVLNVQLDVYQFWAVGTQLNMMRTSLEFVLDLKDVEDCLTNEVEVQICVVCRTWSLRYCWIQSTQM